MNQLYRTKLKRLNGERSLRRCHSRTLSLQQSRFPRRGYAPASGADAPAARGCELIPQRSVEGEGACGLKCHGAVSEGRGWNL